MSDDFSGIQIWAGKRRKISLIELLYAIFNIELHGCIHNPLTLFASMKPEETTQFKSLPAIFETPFIDCLKLTLPAPQ